MPQILNIEETMPIPIYVHEGKYLHLRPVKEQKGAFLGNPFPKNFKFRNEKSDSIFFIRPLWSVPLFRMNGSSKMSPQVDNH